MKPVIFCLIPARGNSKRIPGKNLVPLGGRPLIDYTIDAALDSASIEKIFVSTEDDKIAGHASLKGVEIINRPEMLSQDDTSSAEVFRHAYSFFIENNQNPDYLLVLQPTSPFRTGRQIDEAADIIIKAEGTCLLSVTPSPLSGNWLMKMDDHKLDFVLPKDFQKTRKQDQEAHFFPNGAIYIYHKRLLEKRMDYLWGDPTLGYSMDKFSSMDIDEPEDLALAELILQSNVLNRK